MQRGPNLNVVLSGQWHWSGLVVPETGTAPTFVPVRAALALAGSVPHPPHFWPCGCMCQMHVEFFICPLLGWHHPTYLL